jgi:hypothetical protein
VTGQRNTMPGSTMAMTNSTGWWRWAGAGGLVVILAGCSSTVPNTTSTPQAVDILSQRMIREAGEAEVPVDGTIQLVNGCVGLGLADGDLVPAIWPDNAELDMSDPVVVSWPNGSVEVGQKLSSTNGFLRKVDQVTNQSSRLQQCAGDAAEVMVVSSLEGILFDQ